MVRDEMSRQYGMKHREHLCMTYVLHADNAVVVAMGSPVRLRRGRRFDGQPRGPTGVTTIARATGVIVVDTSTGVRVIER